MQFSCRFALVGVLLAIALPPAGDAAAASVSAVIQYENRNQGWVVNDSSGGPGIATAGRTNSGHFVPGFCVALSPCSGNAYAQASLPAGQLKADAFFSVAAYHQPDAEISGLMASAQASLREDFSFTTPAGSTGMFFPVAFAYSLTGHMQAIPEFGLASELLSIAFASPDVEVPDDVRISLQVGSPQIPSRIGVTGRINGAAIDIPGQSNFALALSGILASSLGAPDLLAGGILPITYTYHLDMSLFVAVSRGAMSDFDSTLQGFIDADPLLTVTSSSGVFPVGAPVPEPSSVLLLGVGLVGMARIATCHKRRD